MEERIYGIVRELEDEHWWFRGRRAVIEALLGRVESPRPVRVLDAGCGTGRNLQLYARLGTAEGIDPSAEAVALCRERGLSGVRQGDAEALPFDDGRFGLVAATDVLEHVADDATALREMRRVAAPEANLLLTVPAWRWLWSSEDERLGHYRRYTLGGLRAAVGSAGWEPLFGTYFNLILLAPIAIVRRLPRHGAAAPELERTPSILNRPLALPMQLEAKLISAGLSLPLGVSIGLVCRRA